MVRTIQTLLHSQLACNEMQASARICGRKHDPKCRLKSNQYTFITHHWVIQLNTISFWVYETRLRLPQVNKFPPKQVKNLVTPSSIFNFSSSTGELCSQPIRGNDHPIQQMFPEHAERNFLDLNIASTNTSNYVHEEKLAQLRTN